MLMTALLIEVIVFHRLEPRKFKGVSLLCIMLGPLCPIWIAEHYIHKHMEECKECEEMKQQRPPPPPVYDPYDPNHNPALPATEVQPDGTVKIVLPNLVENKNGPSGQAPSPEVLPESEILPDGTNKLVHPGGTPSVDPAPKPQMMNPDGTMQPASPVGSPLPEDKLMPDGTTVLARPGTGVLTADGSQVQDQESQVESLQDADSLQLHQRDLTESSYPVQQIRRLLAHEGGRLGLQD
ncbi:hypothetical protein BDV97DRAFT_7493 [Delphinella strobiligena]|nr:hypothetical protein BDV97DRAFT_7493 [Delphinella strobiligena]